MLRRGGKNTPKTYTKKSLKTWIAMLLFTHLEPDILETEVKWALGSITMSKTSGGDRVPADQFKILKVDAVKVLYSVRQQIWKTQQCSQD